MSRPKKYKAQLTPKGVFKFPALTSPDTYKGDTKYKCTLLVDPDDAGVPEFVAKLEKIRDEEIARTKAELKEAGKEKLAQKVQPRPVFYEDEDKEGEPTGKIGFFAKMNAEYKDHRTGNTKQLSPKFFDAKGSKIKRVPEIWGGTVGRLGVDIIGSKRPSDGAIGVTLYLDAVFIIDLNGPGGRDANAYGYTPEENGYSVSDLEDDFEDDESEYDSSGGDEEDDDDDF